MNEVSRLNYSIVVGNMSNWKVSGEVKTKLGLQTGQGPPGPCASDWIMHAAFSFSLVRSTRPTEVNNLSILLDTPLHQRIVLIIQRYAPFHASMT